MKSAANWLPGLLGVLVWTTLVAPCPAHAQPAASSKPASTNSVIELQPVNILGVVVGKDRHSLVVRHELSNQIHTATIQFTNEVSDFRYCLWMQQGIAFAIASTSQGTNEFFFGVSGLWPSDNKQKLTLARIPVYPSRYRLLGVANTGGDSIVVSAIQQRRDLTGQPVLGWMYVDNCPGVTQNYQITGSGFVQPFELGPFGANYVGPDSKPVTRTSSSPKQELKLLIQEPAK